jgi:hypothetical protein
MVMRKLLLIVTLALAIGTAAPAASAWASPGHDQVTGTGTLGQFGDPTAHVNAIQTPAGLNGAFTINYPDGTVVTGSVTCLIVGGVTAYVTGQIATASGPRQVASSWFPGSYIVIGVQDNGQGRTGEADQLNFSPGFATDPGCGPNGAATPVFPIVTGNYRVFAAR